MLSGLHVVGFLTLATFHTVILQRPAPLPPTPPGTGRGSSGGKAPVPGAAAAVAAAAGPGARPAGAAAAGKVRDRGPPSWRRQAPLLHLKSFPPSPPEKRSIPHRRGGQHTPASHFGRFIGRSVQVKRKVMWETGRLSTENQLSQKLKFFGVHYI